MSLILGPILFFLVLSAARSMVPCFACGRKSHDSRLGTHAGGVWTVDVTNWKSSHFWGASSAMWEWRVRLRVLVL